MAARKKPEELRSHRWFGANDLRSRRIARARRRWATRAPDYAGKPVIAIINTWSEINPATRTSASARRK